MSSSHDLGDGLIQLKAVLRIRIRKDPHHFAGSRSAPKPMDPDPTLFHTKLRKDVLQINYVIKIRNCMFQFTFFLFYNIGETKT
jgi:hypothetical protein